MARSVVDTKKFLALVRSDGYTEEEIQEYLDGQGYRERDLPHIMRIDFDAQPEPFRRLGTPGDFISPAGQASGATETDVLLGKVAFRAGGGDIPGLGNAQKTFFKGTTSSGRALAEAVTNFVIRPTIDLVVAPMYRANGMPEQAAYLRDLWDRTGESFSRPTVFEGVIDEIRARDTRRLVESGNTAAAFLNHGLDVVFDIAYGMAEIGAIGAFLPGVAGQAAIADASGLSVVQKAFKAGKATVRNAAKIAFKKALLSPGELGFRAENAAMTFFYMATPAVSQILPGNIAAKMADMALNIGISKFVGEDAYAKAEEAGRAMARETGNEKDAWKYAWMALLPAVGTDIAYSLKTRSVTKGHAMKAMLQEARNDNLSNNLRDIVDIRESELPPQDKQGIPLSDRRELQASVIRNALGTNFKEDTVLLDLPQDKLDGQYRNALEFIFDELGIVSLRGEERELSTGGKFAPQVDVKDVSTDRLEHIAKGLFTDTRLMQDPSKPWYQVSPGDLKEASYEIISQGDVIGKVERGVNPDGDDMWFVEVNKSTTDKTTFKQHFSTEGAAIKWRQQASDRSKTPYAFLQNVLLPHQKKIHASKRLGIVDYFVPQDETMRRLGFFPYIGRTIRNSIMRLDGDLDREISGLRALSKGLTKDLDARNKLVRVQDVKSGVNPKHKRPDELRGIGVTTFEESLADIWHFMNGTGALKANQVLERNVAAELTKISDRMFNRVNAVRKSVGAPPLFKRKNYIFHLLKKEMLDEIERRGAISPGLSRMIDPDALPSESKFLATAEARAEDVPLEWFVKDPFAAVRAMVGIDLKYIHMQKAIKEVAPFVSTVKTLKFRQGKDLMMFQDTTRDFVKDYLKYSVSGHQSMFDKSINNFILNQIEKPLFKGALNMVYKKGAKVNHWAKNVFKSKETKTQFKERDFRVPLNPWESMMDTLISMNQTGLLGMRARPAVRNLLQQSFDVSFYGYGTWGEAMKQTMDPKWWDHAKKNSLTLQSRLPIEGLSQAGYIRMKTNTVFKWGSALFRGSDYVNTMQAITTRYIFATKRLGMGEKEAWQWADDDLPLTQWSYKRVDLPRVYQTTSGRALWQLGSWWMNYYTRLVPELYRRTWHGIASDGRKVTKVERFAGVRHLLLASALLTMAETSGEIFGTTVDYTSQIAPDFLQFGPITQMGGAMIQFGNGFASGNDRQFQEGVRGMTRGASGFIPFFLSGQELLDVINGDKRATDIVFMTRDKKKRTSLLEKGKFIGKHLPTFGLLDAPKFGRAD